jgi:hypothetical protein
MLDTNELYLGDRVHLTFIDQNCDDLRKNLLTADLERIRIFEEKVQDVDLSVFEELEANDLLFVDSSHVMKVGSDVHTILFDILPRLASGVFIHFHDIRYPFQYPKDMIMAGVFWNEAYLLRAFLMNNKSYDIAFWLNYIINSGLPEVDKLLAFLPLSQQWGNFSGAGGSIYIVKKE